MKLKKQVKTTLLLNSKRTAFENNIEMTHILHRLIRVTSNTKNISESVGDLILFMSILQN